MGFIFRGWIAPLLDGSSHKPQTCFLLSAAQSPGIFQHLIRAPAN